jgi:hypothetical protein
MVYLNIPNNGTFKGELYFSFRGCDDTFDVGSINGTVIGDQIDGNWSGNVDGQSVGGKYIGELNNAKNIYSGTYTNSRGKQKVECDFGGYFVAAHGTWYVRGSRADSALDISVEIDSDITQFYWNEIENVHVYRFAIIDRECLLEKMSLEECMVWSGESYWPHLEYGDNDDDDLPPAKPLVKGRTYIINLYAIDKDKNVLELGSKEFIYN